MSTTCPLHFCMNSSDTDCQVQRILWRTSQCSMNRVGRPPHARGYDPSVTNSSILQVDLDDVETFTREFLEELQFGQGVALTRASANDLYMAMARTVRQHLMSRW